MKKEIEIIKEVMKKKSLLIQMICVCFAKHSVEFLILLLRYASLNFLEKFLEQIVWGFLSICECVYWKVDKL